MKDMAIRLRDNILTTILCACTWLHKSGPPNFKSDMLFYHSTQKALHTIKFKIIIKNIICAYSSEQRPAHLTFLWDGFLLCLPLAMSDRGSVAWSLREGIRVESTSWLMETHTRFWQDFQALWCCYRKSSPPPLFLSYGFLHLFCKLHSENSN